MKLRECIILLLNTCRDQGFIEITKACGSTTPVAQPTDCGVNLENWAIVESLAQLLEEPPAEVRSRELNVACALCIGIIVLQHQVLSPIMGRVHTCVFHIDTAQDETLYAVIEPLLMESRSNCQYEDIVILEILLVLMSIRWSNFHLKRSIQAASNSKNRSPWLADGESGLNQYVIGLSVEKASGRSKIEQLFEMDLEEHGILLSQLSSQIL